MFQCSLLKKHSKNQSRVLEIHTAHGTFTTPAFMPVGTRAGVNNLTPQELEAEGLGIILGGNTYHMNCAPGMEVIQKAGGMHRFMGWSGPMLTDSGGFQVFSLSKNEKICTINENEASFQQSASQEICLNPKISLESQKIIGADIIMAFDQCTPSAASFALAEAIMQKTHRWLEESLDYHQKHPNAVYGYPQALFGIVQGGIHRELREQSAAFVAALDLDGVAIGGESIGFDMEKTLEILNWVLPYLPVEKPRYSMGVGMCPQDLIAVTAQGMDIYDCVAPTRNARHGALYCGRFEEKEGWLQFVSPYENSRLQIKKACFAKDEAPIMEDCTCYTCKNHSRAFLHDLFKQKAGMFTVLASIHNVSVMNQTCLRMRRIILS